jgi:hypothetical protein
MLRLDQNTINIPYTFYEGKHSGGTSGEVWYIFVLLVAYQKLHETKLRLLLIVTVTVFLQHRHDQSTIAKACISVIIFQVWFLNIQNKAFFQGKIKLISLGGHTVVTPNNVL